MTDRLTEADTCRKYVLPKLYEAGWDDDRISEQKTFTDGKIVVAGSRAVRKKPKRADYLLRYRRDFTIAVVEAKSIYKKAGDGLQQAKSAEIQKPRTHSRTLQSNPTQVADYRYIEKHISRLKICRD